MMKIIKEMLHSFWLTLFPPICEVCGCKLSDEDRFLCTSCRDGMPLTHHWNTRNNLLFMRIKEHTSISGAMSMFYYTNDGGYDNLILSIKFRNQRDLAVELGRWMGFFFEVNEEIRNVDYLIPIPLHVSRQRWRGYNQSEYICKGLSEVLNIPILTDVVVRDRKSNIQSKMKNREERKKNVEGIFSVVKPELLKGKSILLVDDVITTGSMMISCVGAIKKAAPKCDVYIGAASSKR